MSSSSPLHFLELLAERALANAQTTPLAHQCYVFPSRRAGVFFRHALAQRLEHPSFSPRIYTIEELFAMLSPLRPLERPELIARIYSHDIALRPISKDKSTEEQKHEALLRLDLAETLLGDFNDIDNYLAPVDKIFRNIKHLEELTDLSYLEKEQKEAIQRFWSGFESDTEGAKAKYIALLEKIELLYLRFTQELQAEHCAYSGLLVRQLATCSEEAFTAAVQRLDKSIRSINIAGLFNVTPAAGQVLKRLSQEREVHFYWEGSPIARLGNSALDETLLLGHKWAESRAFLGGETLEEAPLTSQPEVEVVTVSSETLGHKLLPHFIQQILSEEPKAIAGLATAIILPDEKRLLSLTSALAHIPFPLNITMGYPLQQTGLAVWVERFLEMQGAVRRQEGKEMIRVECLRTLLIHPLSRILINPHITESLLALIEGHLYMPLEELHAMASSRQTVGKLLRVDSTPEKLFSHLIELFHLLMAKLIDEKEIPGEEKSPSEATAFATLVDVELEFIKRYKELVLQLRELLPRLGPAPLSVVASLLLHMMRGVSVPFEGEPLEGLQLMGTLESRLLSFDYLIYPSAIEGALPRNTPMDKSLISHSLRVGYGLPDYKTKEETETFHFYRLVARCKKLLFVVESAADKEPTRFIQQLRHLFHLSPKLTTYSLPTNISSVAPIIVEKGQDIMAQLRDYTFSPSSISTYAGCPLSFYYSRLAKLGTLPDDNEILAASALGNMVHNSMETLYTPFIGKEVSFEKLLMRTDDEGWRLHPYAQQVIQKELEQELKISSETLRSIHYLHKEIVEQYILNILLADQALPHLSIVGLEIPVSGTFEYGEESIQIGGKIDRVDRVLTREGNPRLRIVDYKTGVDENIFRPDKPFAITGKGATQVLIYSYLYARGYAEGSEIITPHIYAVRKMYPRHSHHYNSHITLYKGEKIEINVADLAKCEAWIEECLGEIFAELLNPAIPFAQNESIEACRFCSYIDICGRRR